MLRPATFFAVMCGLAAASSPVQAAAQESVPPPPFTSFLQSLLFVEPDPSRTATVSDFVLEREGAVFTFSSGNITLLAPIAGQTVGAVFVGEGSFEFRPSSEVEGRQLERHYEDPVYQQRVSSVVFLFGRGALQEIGDALEFGPQAVSGDARDAVESAIRYVTNEDQMDLDPRVADAIVNGVAPDLLHAHIDPRRGDDVFYRWDPGQREQVSFGREWSGRGEDYEVVSQYAIEGGSGLPRTPDMVVYQYGLDVRLDDDLEMDVRANLVMVAPSSGSVARWASFDLHEGFTVDSAQWMDGEPAEFHRGEESGQLWVRLPAVEPGARFPDLRLAYHGDIVSREGEWYIIESPTGWYPTRGRVNALFAMTFSVPAEYSFVSVGRLLSQREVDDRTVTQWLVDSPSLHASFNVGNFEEYTFGDERAPPLRVQVAERAHARMAAELADAGYLVLEQRDMHEQVGSDVIQSLAFFGSKLGPMEVDSFYVTEIPGLHGQAFPSMIQLSWVTYQWTSREGVDEMFRGHEVAHQWWGLSVRPETYHDRWLSEGLSEFSGLWYMQRVRPDRDLYQERLNEFRRNIMRRRDRAGPIWLGPRVVRRGAEEDYQTIVYEKGAWVIHMLRALMVDLDDMNEAAFEALLRDLYQSHRGRTLSTAQFQELVSAHTGVDMRWFFDQWVYGTAVPKYRFAWTGTEVEDGYQVTVRVKQEEVPDDFIMVVPLFLDFGGEGWARVRIAVSGPLTELELPLLPRRPERIVFNDLDAVLAEVEEERWE